MYQAKLSVLRTYKMTTHYNCFYILSFFYAEVGCPGLRRLENGRIDYNTSYFTIEFLFLYRVNTLASFSCDEYYHREGSSSAICQSSGNWSEETPICAASNENENLYSIDVN